MARLPVPDSDNGRWGNILNDYLSQVHAADGTLKDGTVSLSTITTNTVVDVTNNQIVNGVKNFSSSPLVPTPTTATQAANKSYVDASSGPVVVGNTTGATNATAIDSITGTTGHTIASSDGSIAIGYDGTNAASATGASSVAIGSDSVANGYFATALGPTASANGDSSTAIGWGAEATGEGSVALGGGTYSEAGSQGAYADGDNALAIGTSSATGQQSIAMGSSTADGYEATAVGFNNLAQSDQTTAIGSGNAVYTSNSVAVGLNNMVDSDSNSSIAFGYTARVYSSNNAVAINSDVEYSNGALGVAGFVNNASNATALNGNVNGNASGNAGTANGGVAIGMDSSGIQAQAGVDNQFVLGTPSHNVQVPGTLAISGDTQLGATVTLPIVPPQTPVDGQMWITSGGLYFHANGVTHVHLPDIDIIIISLVNRSDRRVSIASSLEREGLAFSFFDAVPAPAESPPDWKLSLALWGCRESHVSVLENAIRPTLVFEDDAAIPRGFANTLRQLLNDLPNEWAVLRLGGAHVRPPESYSERLVRCRGALYPHAYLVRNPPAVAAGARTAPIDWGTYFMLQDRRNRQTYAANPWLVNTTGSVSDIPDSVPIDERAVKGLAIFTSPSHSHLSQLDLHKKR